MTGEYYLWVKPVTLSDLSGNVQTNTEVSERTYLFDNTAPTVTANPTTAENVESQEITITLADVVGSGLTSTIGQYYLSTNANILENGEWSDFTSGTAFTIGEGLEGEYYLFVKTVSDTVGNISTINGTLVEIDGINYHKFGPYKFEKSDKIAPTIEILTGSETLSADDITVEDYGGYVTNYVPSNGSTVGWRIFHADKETDNIYLIADDIIVQEDYEETSTYGDEKHTFETVSYGPSLYLYADSYNVTHPEETMEIIQEELEYDYENYGYYASYSGVPDDYGQLYFITNPKYYYEYDYKYEIGCLTTSYMGYGYNNLIYSDGHIGNDECRSILERLSSSYLLKV